MTKVSYKVPKNLTKNLIILDGLNRSGKILLGSLVSSFKNMESLEFGENFEHFLPAMKFKHVSSNFSKSFLTNYLKSQRGKSVHGQVPWARNSGNPNTKLIVSRLDGRPFFYCC